MPRSHRELVVWQKSMEMVVQVYDASTRFPAAERFGLTAQVRRAAVSVPANIAEGNGRGSVNDYRRSIAIARGSLMEVETMLSLAIHLGFLAPETAAPTMSLVTEISRMLVTLRARLSGTIRT